MPTILQFFCRHFLIIDRYLFREFATNLLAVTSLLWLIFVATRFARYLAQAATGNLPSDVIFALLGYSSLSALSLLLPMATFLAVMLSLGRMNADNELNVMLACGLSDQRLVRNIGIFSGVVAIIVAILSLWVVPSLLSERYEMERTAKVSADTSGLVAGGFKESRDGEWTFYAEKLTDDRQSMINIFIVIHRDSKPIVFRAEKGRFHIDEDTESKYLILENGYRYEGQGGSKDFIIAQYETHSLLIEQGGEKQIREKQKALPTAVLWQRGSKRDWAEIQWRFSAIIMTVLLSLVAAPLAKTKPRKGRYAGLFPAILIYIIYSNLLGMTSAWISKGVVTPWLGAIWVHLFVFIVFILLFNRHKLYYYWLQYKRRKEAFK